MERLEIVERQRYLFLERSDQRNRGRVRGFGLVASPPPPSPRRRPPPTPPSPKIDAAPSSLHFNDTRIIKDACALFSRSLRPLRYYKEKWRRKDTSECSLNNYQISRASV